MNNLYVIIKIPKLRLFSSSPLPFPWGGEEGTTTTNKQTKTFSPAKIGYLAINMWGNLTGISSIMEALETEEGTLL